MEENTLSVLKIAPGQYPQQVEIDNDLKALQQAVGGSIGASYPFENPVATVYKGNIIKNLIMDCQSYTKYRPNETTGGIFVSWRRKEELPTGA